MTTLDIIRLAAERAEMTGDIDRPEFHEVVAEISARTPEQQSAPFAFATLSTRAAATAAALREGAKAQMEFRALLSTLTTQPSAK